MSVDTSSILYQLGQAVKAAGESGGDVDLSGIEGRLTTTESDIAGHETRLSAAESEIVALGGQTPPPTGNLTIADVQWTNLTEINLSGEKILNGSFDATNVYTENTTVALAVGLTVRINTAFSKNNVDYAQFEIVTISTIGGSGNIEFEKTDGTTGFIGNNSNVAFERGNFWEVVDVAPNYQHRSDVTLATGQSVLILQTHDRQGLIYTAGEIVTIGQIFSDTNSSNNGAPQLIKENTEKKYAQLSERGTNWEVVTILPINWELVSGELDSTELALGNVNGTESGGGSVSLMQRFSEGLTTGTYQVLTNLPPNQTGSVTLTTLKYASPQSTPQSQQVVWTKNGVESTGTNVSIVPGDEVSFNPSIADVYGIRIQTNHGSRTITDISLFKGETSGGTVEVTGNSIRKIAGDAGFNSGASSTQSIPNGENGYFQFQYAGGNVVIGVVYQDTTYGDTNAPAKFQVEIRPGNKSVTGDGFNSGNDFLVLGDFFRIRHYSSTNEIKFQKKQTIYGEDTDYVFPTTPTSGVNHVFDTADRPLVQAIQSSTNGLVAGELYIMHAINVNETGLQFEVAQLYEIDGTSVGWFARSFWQVVKEIGQDYVTFFTPSLLTTNGNLFLDVSLSQLTSQINDAKIATLNT